MILYVLMLELIMYLTNNVQMFPTNKKQDFSTQLNNILNSSEHNFCLYYLDSTKEEGLFTFGIMPHNFSKDYSF